MKIKWGTATGNTNGEQSGIRITDVLFRTVEAEIREGGPATAVLDCRIFRENSSVSGVLRGCIIDEFGTPVYGEKHIDITEESDSYILTITIPSVRLWRNMESPHLYSVYCMVYIQGRTVEYEPFQASFV